MDKFMDITWREFYQKQLKSFISILQLNSKYILVDRKIRLLVSGTLMMMTRYLWCYQTMIIAIYYILSSVNEVFQTIYFIDRQN